MDLPHFVVGVVEGGHLTLKNAVSSAFDTKECHTKLLERALLRIQIKVSRGELGWRLC